MKLRKIEFLSVGNALIWWFSSDETGENKAFIRWYCCKMMIFGITIKW